MQTRLAQELHETFGVSLGACGISEVKKFQAALPGYQLNVVSKEHLNALIYSSPDAEKHLNLYHHDNHYNVITSIPDFLARKQYCHTYKKGFDKINDHPCGDLCKLDLQYTELLSRRVEIFAKTATDFSRVMNASTSIKMIPVLPNLYAVP